MSSTRVSRAATAFALAALVACGSSSGTRGSSSGDGGSGTSGDTCVGTPPQCNQMLVCTDTPGCDDVGSPPSVECTGRPIGCSYGNDSKDRCLGINGCVWKNPDGSTEKVRGQCSGTPTPCSSLTDESTCQNQPSDYPFVMTLCLWSGTTCTQQQGASDPGCGGAVTDATVNGDHLVSPTGTRSRCMRRAGCTWTPTQ